MELHPDIGIKESDELEVLALIIDKYESENWNISSPDPIEATKL
jgi:HTH-type transcriptional regulator/antitoxin HigA